MVTKEQVAAILPGVSHLDEYYPFLVAAMLRFDIDIPARIGAFLAQCGEESNRFHAFKEYASGSEYEGRSDLGNTWPGDGVRFKGRGAIQVTGRRNYTSLSVRLYKDDRLLTNPELLEQPEAAFLSAGDYWESRNLNRICDLPETWIHPGSHQYTKFQWITVLVNGGLNGYDQRLLFYNNARKALSF